MRKPTAKQLKDIRADMLEVLENTGPYQHNIISCTLRIISEKYGNAVADKLVEQYRLEERFSIDPEIPKQVGKALSD